MKYALGFLILVAVGAVLRRLLRLDAQVVPRAKGLLPLNCDREAIYQPVALEVETQAAIIGIALNDAIDERDSEHHEIAWRLVRLCASEWDRLAKIVTVLLNAIAQHMATAQVAVPVHGVAAHRFKSQTMIDYVRMHEALDQLVFRSKVRFQLHIRVLRRAVGTLNMEFRRTYRTAERTLERPAEFWSRLDLYFHDLDLVAKETLLAFRAFLACLPQSALEGFAADLKPVVRRGVRSTSVAADPQSSARDWR